MAIIIPISEVEQNTDAWHELRLGIPTSSEFSRILTTKGKRSKSWQGYIDQLTVERLTKTVNTFETWQMRLGHEQEPKARWLYEQMNGVTVERVAFIYKDESRRVGCSTDGLVGPNGIFEAKGGEGKKQIQRLRDHETNPDKFTTEHFHQLQGELYVTGREWVDLFGYFPGMRPLEVRVYRDEPWIKALDEALNDFYKDLEKAVDFARAA